jgi:opacity protein-like surface antigen
MKIFTLLVLLVLITSVLVLGQTADQKIDDRIEIVNKKMYVKGNFLMGLGFDKVLAAKKYFEDKDDVDDIYIRPGGGFGVEGVVGYDITSAIAGEIGIGYQFSGESVSNGHVYFNKFPLRASILYKSTRSIKQFSPYCGVGISMNLLTKYVWEEDDDKGSITYRNPAGFHGIAGAEFNPAGSPLYFSGEIRFVSMADYEVKSYKVNGSDVLISSVRTDFRKLGSSGLHFILTLGYYLN